jgi:hypothetical protein
MAGLLRMTMSTLKEKFWWSTDLIFPWPTPLTPKEQIQQTKRRNASLAECESRVESLTDDQETLKDYLEQCDSRVQSETDRGQGVEGRLTSILGLSSIAGTIVFGSILAAATGAVHAQRVELQWIICLGAIYLTVQLGSAIFAAVRGLARRHYYSESAPEILPTATEVHPAYLKRRIRSRSEELIDRQERNNEKVTQMAVAHQALKNFVVALLLFAVVGTLYGVRASGSNDTIELLKKNKQLLELLRGPEGNPGVPGPPGPKGDPGKSTSSANQKRQPSKPCKCK